MKWSDLSFKEKKQIYDSIKAQNPDTTYLDIKSQFDSIPAYEDGGKKIMPPKELGLTPGTPSNVDDYSIVLDPSTYIPGTANHELGHIADGIAGSIKYEAEPGVDYITNPYLRYLADPSNTYTTKELRDAGFHSAAKNKRYLLNPTESKSHMLTLKRALKDSNKISKWSDPVDENMILDYFISGRANGAVRNQYDLYIDKQRYIDRLNRLVPMEWLLPTIGLGGAEFLREKQNNKSN